MWREAVCRPDKSNERLVLSFPLLPPTNSDLIQEGEGDVSHLADKLCAARHTSCCKCLKYSHWHHRQDAALQQAAKSS